MAVGRLQHCFQDVSNDSKDRYCNTFHFDLGSAVLNDTLWLAVAEAVREFYKPISSPGLQPWISPRAIGVGRTIKIYNLADPMPRTPRWSAVDSAPFTSSGQQPLPNEVAVCISYEGIAAPGTIRARRRGRIYIGPLGVNAIEPDTSAACRPEGSLQAACLVQMQQLADALSALGLTLGVYSPTDNLLVPISRVWVDNAFDTQRRRGIAPTDSLDTLIT